MFKLIHLCKAQSVSPFQSQNEVRIDHQHRNLQPTEINKIWFVQIRFVKAGERHSQADAEFISTFTRE